MSAHAYTEDLLVEQPAKRLVAELGWGLAQPHPHPDPLPAGEGVWVDESGLFSRETKGDMVLVSRLCAALERLNPALPPEAISSFIEELARGLLPPPLLLRRTPALGRIACQIYRQL